MVGCGSRRGKRQGLYGARVRVNGAWGCEARSGVAQFRIDASHFSPDTRAFLESLAAKEVRYVVVGGEAVILHGHVRPTGDVDFLFARDPLPLPTHLDTRARQSLVSQCQRASIDHFGD